AGARRAASGGALQGRQRRARSAHPRVRRHGLGRDPPERGRLGGLRGFDGHGRGERERRAGGRDAGRRGRADPGAARSGQHGDRGRRGAPSAAGLARSRGARGGAHGSARDPCGHRGRAAGGQRRALSRAQHRVLGRGSMTERISVTEVRNALRCPRIFALGRLRKKAVAFPVGSSCLGATFHRVVERFHRTVDRPPAAFEALAAGAPRDDVETELAAWLLAIAVEELAGDPSYASIPAEVDDLAEALRELARHLAGRLTRFEEPPARALARLVQAGERPVEARLDPEGALVHGRIDALFRDPSGALEVVEYKLTDVANDELDRAQVALYRELLRVSEGLSARPTVLRFTPTLRESAASAGATDHWVQSSLRPLLRSMVGWAAAPTQAPATDRRDLCAACPTARDCSEVFPAHLAPRDDPPMAAARPRPEGETLGESTPVGMTSRGEADAEGRREAEGIQHRIVEELQRQGTAVKCPRPAIVGPTLYLIEVARLRGPVSHLDRAAEDVVHRLAAEDAVEIEYRKEGGHRWFYVRRREPRRVELSPLLEQKRQWLSASSGRFLVGQEPGGTIVGGDLGDASTPHLLIGGQSGSGKSVLIQAIIASLLHYHGPEAIRFTLVDPKRVTFIGPGFQAA